MTNIVQHSPYGSLPVQRGPNGLNAAVNWDPDNQENIEPIHVTVPIGLCQGLIRDMYLLGVIASVPVGF